MVSFIAQFSDHSLIYSAWKAGVPKAAPRIIEHRLYKNYDKDVFIHHFNKINWDLNVETAFKLWNDLFTSVADQHAPIKQTRWKGFQAPRIISDLNQTMRDRDFHHSKVVKTKSPHHSKMKKKKLRLYVNKLVCECKSDNYQDLILKNKGNPSKLWKTLNDVIGQKNTPSVTYIVDEKVTYTDKSIAEILNSFFTSIGSTLSKLMPITSQLVSDSHSRA